MPLRHFEEIIPFLANDEHCQQLVEQIELKIQKNLQSAESFISNQLVEHHLVNDFVQKFDTHDTIDEIFSTNGHNILYKLLENFKCWELSLSGKLYTFGCASMSTSHFANENIAKIKAIKNMVQTAVEFRLREEVENYSKIAAELSIELLNAKDCEKLALLAKNIGTVNERREQARNIQFV